jgi:hypothetical protein
MRKTAIITALAIALLPLTGCGGATPAPTHTAAAQIKTYTATPTPTPTVMNNADAGAKYLAIVCPGNNASNAFQAAWQTQDIAQIQAAAISARDIYRSQATQFLDPTILWPDAIKPDLKTLSDSDFSSVAAMDQISKSTSVEEAAAVTGGDTTVSNAAAQRIRAILGLTADTSTGC